MFDPPLHFSRKILHEITVTFTFPDRLFFLECLITNYSAEITIFVNKTLHPLYATFRFSLSDLPFVVNNSKS